MPFTIHDFISPDITLYFHHCKKHTSFISKILSVLTVLFITAISTIILKDFFLRKHPNAYYYNQFINDSGVFYFNKSMIFHSITFLGDLKYDSRQSLL